MDQQKVYNKVRKHLLKQNAKSMARGFCSYRGNDNTKCAIGCLISDINYTNAIEGLNVWGGYYLLYQVLVDELGVLAQKDLTFLSELQNIHDLSAPAEWPKLLNEFAQEYKLKA